MHVIKMASIGVIALIAAAGSASAAMRCGWIVNPTPSNWWLNDAQGQWIIKTQGVDYDPDGMDMIPDLTTRDWVVTNGSSYGYGCACMNVDTDEAQVTRIRSFRQLPLSKCENDPALRSPEE